MSFSFCHQPQFNWVIFFFCIKKKIPPATVLNIVMAEVKKKSVWDWHYTVGMGKERLRDNSTLATCFHPLLTPTCFSGASSPARPATPLVPCSSTTPPPPPPRPPSRPKLPPGKPGVGDVVCSLCPGLLRNSWWQWQTGMKKTSPGPSLFRVQALVTCTNGPDR